MPISPQTERADFSANGASHHNNYKDRDVFSDLDVRTELKVRHVDSEQIMNNKYETHYDISSGNNRNKLEEIKSNKTSFAFSIKIADDPIKKLPH